ncbi:MAG: hypothetical protein Crog4KO_36260 [Crocinitomicaceae bacterium]
MACKASPSEGDGGDGCEASEKARSGHVEDDKHKEEFLELKDNKTEEKERVETNDNNVSNKTTMDKLGADQQKVEAQGGIHLQNQNFEGIQLQTKIRGIRQLALLDSGATANFIDQTLVETLGLQIRPHFESVKVANKEETKTVGKVEFRLKCGNGSFLISALVFPKLLHGLILG